MANPGGREVEENDFVAEELDRDRVLLIVKELINVVTGSNWRNSRKRGGRRSFHLFKEGGRKEER